MEVAPLSCIGIGKINEKNSRCVLGSVAKKIESVLILSPNKCGAPRGGELCSELLCEFLSNVVAEFLSNVVAESCR